MSKNPASRLIESCKQWNMEFGEFAYDSSREPFNVIVGGVDAHMLGQIVIALGSTQRSLDKSVCILLREQVRTDLSSSLCNLLMFTRKRFEKLSHPVGPSAS
jgi:hypothetical protein